MRKLFVAILAALSITPSTGQTLPMDYSYCGYHHSEQPIPAAKVALYVQPTGGDDAALLQAAIDQVSRQKPDKTTGLRGAVLLGEGIFTVSQPLRLHTSGVVLRGSGRDKTVVRKQGVDRGALLYIEGTHDIIARDTFDVADAAPGATTLTLHSPITTHHSPMTLIIWRPSTEEWIASLGCQSFGGGKRMGYWAWHPGDTDLRWHRRVTAVNGTQVSLDAPITCSIESRWGGAKAIVYEQAGMISECGVENLTLESCYDPSLPKDEDHCWDGVYLADAENCWVRMVNFRHFAGSAVVVQKSAQQVTVEDCQSLQPVSEIGGFRRRTFFTLGEMVLFQRCYSEQGINDFAVGHSAPGPNAFVQCESYESLGPSGAISSWAPGLLFDIVNIDGNDLMFGNWELEKFGAGWSTANSTLWQSTASALRCYSPDSLNRNYSNGCWGQIFGSGEYTEMNEHVKPYSLFASQLAKRLGHDVKDQCRVLERDVNASSSPEIEEAIRLAKEALQPRLTMQQWIDSATFTADTTPIKTFYIKSRESETSGKSVFTVNNGWLTCNGSVLVGGKHQTPWWSGRTHDAFLPQAKYALTRFVPGQEGTGLTDRIDSVVTQMQQTHTLVFSQNYGLWTDRRRDDHERIRRKNGDAWAPFFEQPFARTGNGTAWDGMSKYDLTKPNKWYFNRLRQFAEKAQPQGMLLKLQHYFQHNILEAGAHWVDCPWRTVNNVNQTPFLEPVNFTGDKRIFTAEQFYDTDNATLRRLHRQYIRQQLDAFSDQPNVIHSIGEEFTGPLHFVQFWLDVISEWQQEHGQHVLVALAVNKDVQDAILTDPVRSKVVDIIDIEQWFRHAKGEYAPLGGVNMAPRQYQRKIRTGSARFEDVYGEVLEYRQRYPDKAVVYWAQKFPELCWASLMAGGSCAPVPVTAPQLLADLTTMQPRMCPGGYMLEGDAGKLVYRDAGDTDCAVELGEGRYTVYRVDASTGSVKKTGTAKQSVVIKEKGIFWIKKN